MEKEDALLVGMQTGVATVENSMEKPQKLKTELPFDPVILFSEYIQRNTNINSK